jgi:molybdopterin/thiamine biosynthesis adenylyltransferase/proteasome lid subunit RPN8/RPN11
MSNITQGHALAIEELQKIASDKSGALEIIAIAEKPTLIGWLEIEISVSCKGMEVVDGGMPLRQREEMVIGIPSDFPFSAPEARFSHYDYGFYPHVQWGCHLCLYLSSQDWTPNEGMFGFIERLNEWLKRAGIDELDETGQALHPPSIFVGVPSKFSISCDVSLPELPVPHWLGTATLEHLNNQCFAVREWQNGTPARNGAYCAILCINEHMPYEYPHHVGQLFNILEKRGVKFIDIVKHLMRIVSKKISKDPLLLVICAPMMGIKGRMKKEYHIACWEIDNTAEAQLRAINNYVNGLSTKAKTKFEKAKTKFLDWINTSPTHWCTVYDERPEIYTRRDNVSPLAIFQGKSIGILGCGAIGSNIALMLARAGIKRIALFDNKQVSPGVLVRQPYKKNQCHQDKVFALKELIGEISQDIEITTHTENLKTILLENPEVIPEDVDFLFDCTASNIVQLLIENACRKKKFPCCTTISMAFDGNCQNSIALLLPRTWCGSIYSAFRKSLSAYFENEKTSKIADRFLKGSEENLFQPIPGCSEPTFTGSIADTQSLASQMLNLVSKQLHEGSDDATAFIASSCGNGLKGSRITLPSDMSLVDAMNKYDVRISQQAFNEIKKIIWSNPNKKNETGGILFGYVNDAIKTVWIDHVTPPPPDSKATPTKFVCGIKKVKEISDDFKNKYRGQILCIGTWHTHPKSSPLPSETDLLAVASIFLQDDVNREQTVMLIVQPTGNDEFTLGAYLFKKKQMKIIELHK